MKSKILKLNRQYCDELIGRAVYLASVNTLLLPLDWQERLQFENLLLA
jgi:hypothetical protein